jgi:glycosyltransferase involved in cell wall biosynthesis
MLSSYSVIVPVLNRQAEIVRTLRSIGDSMSFFDAHHARAAEVHGEVVVVDEGSTDGTIELVRELASADCRLRIIQHHRAMGIGPARNTGVLVSTGQVLFFCDGDDLFFPEHIFVGFSLIEASEGAAAAGATGRPLQVEIGGRILASMRQPSAVIRTGVHLSEAILPYWKLVVRNSLAQNVCVRRECHEWIEGFPREAVYKRIGGGEDCAYSLLLETFFRVEHVPMETVEYVCRPGNSFDVQLKRFQNAPGSEFDVPPPVLLPLNEIRSRLEEEKISYLLDKWNVLGPPPLVPAMLHWEHVLVEWIRRRNFAQAVRVAEEANRYGQTVPRELTDQLTRYSRQHAE